MIRWIGLSLAAAAGAVSSLASQEVGWNQDRVLTMVQEGRRVRQIFVQDSTLRSYSSQARGRVYFYLDREDTGERILVKTDQIALEVYWRAPNQFKQRIVGLRDEKTLPTNIRYHLDHLVVVQNEFGDRIRIGDGDEVEAVLHPLAPGSEEVYDFLLADSVTLNLPASNDTVRVYEIQVRPRDFQQPGFVGAVFLDRGTMSVVRMSFTFTPASYVDEYLDQINISLENGLWLGQHWLPFRQQLEIRREVPFLDFPAGSVIRGSFRVGDYQINPSLPPSLFMGPTISALPEAARRSFPFEEDLHGELEEEGLEGFRKPPDMQEIRSMAASIARDRYLSGLGRTRLFLPRPTVSSALRYNRAEGWFMGAGVSHLLRPELRFTSYGGFAFGRQRPTLELALAGSQRYPDSSFEVFWNRPRNLGPEQAISGVMNTLSSNLLKEDFTDLFFASGIRASHTFAERNNPSITFEGRLEEHRSARNVVSSNPEDSEFRSVQSVDQGTWSSLALMGVFHTPWPGLSLSLEGLAGWLNEEAFGSIQGALVLRRAWLEQSTDLRLTLKGGRSLGASPLQSQYYLGGRGTVPGYGFRSYQGEAFWLFSGEATTDLLAPFLRLRAFAAAGYVGREQQHDILLDRRAGGSDSSTLLSAGLGLGLGWDVLRFDLARGLRGDGDWEVILSVNPDFWPWL